MYWTDIHQIFTTGRPMCGTDQSDIRSLMAQGTLLWKPILRQIGKKWAYLTFIHRPGVPERIEEWQPSGRVHTGDESSTSDGLLVSFDLPSNVEYSLSRGCYEETALQKPARRLRGQIVPFVLTFLYSKYA